MIFRGPKLYFFLGAIRRVWCAVCARGTVIYAPFPGLDAIVQATVVSDIIDGSFIVQWTGSPNLCNDSTSRAMCVVNAANAYNGNVWFLSNLVHNLGEILLFPSNHSGSSSEQHNTASGAYLERVRSA